MDTLRISEIYLSIQGESSLAGWPCVFVRTTGCPLRCSWCDTAYAFDGGELLPRAEVLERVLAYGAAHVEVTGGEPLVQPGVRPLMRELCDAGQTVLIETSGALEITGIDPRVRVILDVKCPDSAMSDRNLWSNLEQLKPIDEVKFVIASRRDYEYARRIIGEQALADRCTVLLSSAFGLIEQREIVEWMLADRLPARFQLQLHKYVWPPDQRGV